MIHPSRDRVWQGSERATSLHGHTARPLSLRARRLVVGLLDWAAVAAAVAGGIWAGSGGPAHLLAALGVLLVAWPLLATSFRAYGPDELAWPLRAAPALVRAAPVAACAVVAVTAGGLGRPWAALIAATLAAPVGACILRALSLSVLALPRFRHRLVLVGASLDDVGTALGPLAGRVMDVVASANTDELEEVVAAANATMIATGLGRDAGLDDTLARMRERGIEVVRLSSLIEEITGRVSLAYADLFDVISDPSLARRFGVPVKRAIDLVGAGVGLAFVAIAFPLLAVAIYLGSPGPIFHRQIRVGKGGRPFRVYKFRSMIPDAEPKGAVWASAQDERVTRVGRILRATHIDEFPQFLNIIRGEMSLVGPRPERPEFVRFLGRESPLYSLRHSVKPGMGGWGLVRQGYGASVEDALEKLEYDLYYVKHQSLWLDAVIAFRTVSDTVTFRGR